MEVNETRCDHIPFYRPSYSKPSILELGSPIRHDPDGRSILDGSILLRGWDGISEEKIKMPAHSSVLAKGKIPRCKCSTSS